MSTAEIKSEIQQVLETVPENALQHILDYLKDIQSHSADDVKFTHNLHKILAENRGLLERLAK